MPDFLIRGLASVFNNVDLGGDIVMPGAFAASIARNSSVPIFWEHEHGFFASETLPIGRTTRLEETEEGLFFEGPPVPTTRGLDVMRLLLAGVVNQASIGFNVREDGFEIGSDGIRRLFEIDLVEVSVVTWGMNPSTRSGLVAIEPATAPANLQSAEFFASALQVFAALQGV